MCQTIILDKVIFEQKKPLSYDNFIAYQYKFGTWFDDYTEEDKKMFYTNYLQTIYLFRQIFLN